MPFIIMLISPEVPVLEKLQAKFAVVGELLWLGVTVTEGVTVGVGDNDCPGVLLGVILGVTVTVGVTLGVIVTEGVIVTDGVTVTEGVMLGVTVIEGVILGVTLGVGDTEGVGIIETEKVKLLSDNAER